MDTKSTTRVILKLFEQHRQQSCRSNFTCQFAGLKLLILIDVNFLEIWEGMDSSHTQQWPKLAINPKAYFPHVLSVLKKKSSWFMKQYKKDTLHIGFDCDKSAKNYTILLRGNGADNKSL